MGRGNVCLAVGRALESALEFLFAANCSTEPAYASWRDFDLYAGESDEWVTAYAGYVLAGIPDERARQCAGRAWAWLERRAHGRAPGFRFNDRASPDADSTAWACRLARCLDSGSRELTSALDFLASCRQPDGGISTYPSRRAVRGALRVPADMSVEGWASSHVCVTAAAADIAEFCGDRTRAFLRDEQMPSGEWRAYWWCDPEYATAFAIEALAGSSAEADRRAVELAAWYLRTGDSGNSGFTLALRMIGLHAAGCEPPEDLANRLIELQEADGAWPSAARLRIPAPYERDPDVRWNWDENHKGIGGIRLDRNRIFTTATAVRALATFGAK